jgi:hypothetical protein
MLLTLAEVANPADLKIPFELFKACLEATKEVLEETVAVVASDRRAAGRVRRRRSDIAVMVVGQRQQLPLVQELLYL